MIIGTIKEHLLHHLIQTLILKVHIMNIKTEIGIGMLTIIITNPVEYLVIRDMIIFGHEVHC